MPLIAWNDLIENADTVLSSPGYAFAPTLPITLLKTSRLGARARVVTGNGVVIRADLPAESWVRIVSLLNSNLVPAYANQYQARLYWLGTLVATKNVQVDWPNAQTRQFPQHLHAVFPQAYVADRVEITCTGYFYAPDGTPQLGGFEAGRLWASDAWVFDGVESGFQSNWAPRVVDDGSTTISVGGQKFHQRRRRRRGLDVSFKNFSTAMTIGTNLELLTLGPYYSPNLVDIINDVGTTKELIVLPRDSELERHKVGLYCSLNDIQGPTHAKGQLFDCTLRMTESF